MSSTKLLLKLDSTIADKLEFKEKEPIPYIEKNVVEEINKTSDNNKMIIEDNLFLESQEDKLVKNKLNSSSDFKCFFCGQLGHMAGQCGNIGNKNN
jgi:hypothetical protein